MSGSGGGWGLYAEEGRKEITLLGPEKRSVARSRLVSKTEVGRRRRRREHIYARTDYPPQAFPLIGSIMEARALIGFLFSFAGGHTRLP